MSSGYAWVIAIVSFLGCAVVDGLSNSFTLLYDGVALKYPSSSRAQIVLAGSMMSGGFMLFGPAASLFVQHYGYRLSMMFGSILTTTSIVIAANFAGNIYSFILFYGVFAGVGLSFIYIPSMISVTDYFSEERRATALGVSCAGGGSGILIVAPLVVFLLREFQRDPYDVDGWSNAVTLLAGVPLQCCVLGALMKPLRKSQILISDVEINKIKIEVKNSGHTCEADGDRRKDQSASLLNIVRPPTTSKYSIFVNPCFGVLALSSCLIQLAYYAPLVFLSDYVHSLEEDVSSRQILNLFFVFGIANTIGRLLGGFLSNQKRVNLLHLYALSLVMAGTFTICNVYLSSTLFHVSLYLCCLGFCTAIFVPTATVLLIEYVSLKDLSTCFSWLSVVRGLSSMCGSPLSGFIRDSSSSYVTTFLFSAALFILGGVSIYLLPFARKYSNENGTKKIERSTDDLSEIFT